MKLDCCGGVNTENVSEVPEPFMEGSKLRLGCSDCEKIRLFTPATVNVFILTMV